MANNRINCHKCKYYYVTWENQHPHGCKAMGFKSKIFPSIVVFQSSGDNCKYYTPKNKNRAGKKKSIIV
jgi:hypothetical protein